MSAASTRPHKPSPQVEPSLHRRPLWVLSLGFTLVLGLMTVLLLLALQWMNNASERLEQVVNVHYSKAQHALNMRIAARDRTVALQKMLFLDDPFDVDEAGISFQSHTGKFIKHRQQLKKLPLSDTDNALLEAQTRVTREVVPIQNRIAQLRLDGEVDKPRRLMMEQALPLQDAVFVELDKLIALQNSSAENALSQAQQEYSRSLRFMGVLLGATLLVSIAIVFYVVRYVNSLNQRLENQVIERTEQLSLAKAEAEHATQTKSHFLAYVSHEIRNPLHGLLGLIRVAHQDAQCPPQIAETLECAEHAGDGLQKLVTDVLDFSKIEAGKFELQENDYDLHEKITQSIELMRSRAQEKQLALKLQQSDDLPRWIHGDAQRLHQVLINLLSNAIKFTEQGEVGLWVHFDAQAQRLKFHVWDTGMGMSTQAQAALFQPFAQAHQDKLPSQVGTGLGLSLCKEILALMGGKIQVSSKLDQGSIFEFSVPYIPPHQVVTEDLTAQLGAMTTSVAEQATQHVQSILVADDSPINRRLAQAMCNKMHIQADIAEDGKKAVEFAQHTHYDLILMDCDMPILDGLAAATQIRQHSCNQDTPIVAMTASTQEDARQNCLRVGMNDFLFKPYQQEDLSRLLKRWSH